MELLHFVTTIWLFFFLTLVVNYDTRNPMSAKLRYKYRVNDDSIFRKIIKFNDKKHYPCNYFKIVPIYVFLLLSIIGLLLLSVDIFCNGIITNTVPEKAFIIIMVCIISISILYFLSITIWWEIIDYNEMKLTKEEKQDLKRLRNLAKENKSNKS